MEVLSMLFGILPQNVPSQATFDQLSSQTEWGRDCSVDCQTLRAQ